MVNNKPKLKLFKFSKVVSTRTTFNFSTYKYYSLLSLSHKILCSRKISQYRICLHGEHVSLGGSCRKLEHVIKLVQYFNLPYLTGVVQL